VHEISPATPVNIMGIPSTFIPQGQAEHILARLGLDANGIIAAVRRLALPS
jgi:deoxyxylulose-5-phosphate synthase